MKVIENEDRNYPKRLLEIKNPPKRLYVEGNEKLLNNKSLAIVGSRKCSKYGIKHTKIFAEEIANHNVTIVSGLAIGIDSIAHEISKDCKGKTIAVLGSGLNYIYPEENKKLYKEILDNGGLIISEYEPDEEVDMKNFPKRNRLISGISMGVLVIEAGYRSGSTITARYGFEQNKRVFCLPRDIGITNGIGTNELIKKGAKLVTSPKEVLKEIGIKCGEEEIMKDLEGKEPNIPKEYQEIYNLITYIPKNIQYIAIDSGCKISEVNQKLTMLELEGYIQRLPGNNYVRS